MEKSDSNEKGYPRGAFRVSQWDIAKFLMLRKGKTGGLLAACAVIALLSYGIAAQDIRFIILSMMLLFILIPMVYSFIFIKDMLHPDIAFNTLPHFLEVDKASGELRVMVLVKKEAENEIPEDMLENEQADSEVSWEAGSSKRIPLSSLGLPYLGIKNIIYPIKDSGWIFIPYASIKSNPDLDNLHYGEE